MIRNRLGALRPLPLLVFFFASHPGAAAAQAVLTTTSNPYRSVVVNAPSPYWGYSYDPYGSYLHGAADVTRAQGQWLIYQQEAIALREKNLQAKLVTRRQELEHWAWEREFKMDFWDRERKRVREMEVERSRTDPPLTEIVAGISLNMVLAELKKEPALSQGASVAVRPEWLEHVHVTFVTSGAGGNVGLLKGDHLAWPLLLRHEDFAPQRERIDKLIARAKQEALRGGVKAETLIETRRLLNDVEQRVARDIRAGRSELWSPGDYIGANRALREVRAALQMLEREDAAYYLAPLQGSNVAELVQSMKAKGLSFAPATTGGERFYVALHRALAEELTHVRSQK